MKIILGYKHFRIFLIFLVLTLMLIGCSSVSGGKDSFGSTGILKQPVQNLNPARKDARLTSNPKSDVFVDLPLLLWPSFEYRRISRNYSMAKEEHCLITESEGNQLQIGTKVEVLDEAKCLYVLLSAYEGVPRPYMITLMQIRVVETGEKGWTWSKAIEFDKK